MTPTPYVYNATCDRVIDGDTFVAKVDLGFEVSIKIKVRLQGVNSPEHNAPGGPAATAYLTSLVFEDLTDRRLPLLLASHRDQRSFERWVCDVWIPVVIPPEQTPGWTSLAETIIANGHGVPANRLVA